MDAVIHASHLAARYGRSEAVRDASFTVPPGTVYALLGPNGAGKTTTIRALLNILRRSAGEAHVLGVDSRQIGPRELAAIGFVSESQSLPLWMTVGELIAFCRPLYPTWDDALCATLVSDFRLPLDKRIGRLSRGLRVKAALVVALAYRPTLLVLDEPFSGLDPVVRDDLIHGVLQRAGEERWSVLLSSHDLDEVERLVDTVGFMDGGRVVLSEPLSELQFRFRRVEVTLLDAIGPPEATSPSLPAGAIAFTTAGRIVRFVTTKYSGEETDRDINRSFPQARVELSPMTLREKCLELTPYAFNPRARVTVSPAWVEGAELVVLETTYAGRIQRTVTIDDFQLPVPGGPGGVAAAARHLPLSRVERNRSANSPR